MDKRYAVLNTRHNRFEMIDAWDAQYITDDVEVAKLAAADMNSRCSEKNRVFAVAAVTLT